MAYVSNAMKLFADIAPILHRKKGGICAKDILNCAQNVETFGLEIINEFIAIFFCFLLLQ